MPPACRSPEDREEKWLTNTCIQCGCPVGQRSVTFQSPKGPELSQAARPTLVLSSQRQAWETSALCNAVASLVYVDQPPNSVGTQEWARDGTHRGSYHGSQVPPLQAEATQATASQEQSGPQPA